MISPIFRTLQLMAITVAFCSMAIAKEPLPAVCEVPGAKPPMGGAPIRLIVTMQGGTPPDILARTVTNKLEQKYGLRFLIDNRGGASGANGMRVARDAVTEDGRVLVFPVSGDLVLNPQLKTPSHMARYSPDDFSAIAFVANAPFMVACNTERLPDHVKTVDEFVAHVRKNRMTMATMGPTTMSQVASLRLAEVTGLSLGSGQGELLLAPKLDGGLTEVIGGHSDCLMSTQFGLDSELTSSKNRLRAVGASTRNDVRLSDKRPVSAFNKSKAAREYGEVTGWAGFAGHPKMKKEMKECLNAMVQETVSKDLEVELEKLGLLRQTTDPATPDDFQKFIKSQTQMLADAAAKIDKNLSAEASGAQKKVDRD